MGDRADLHFGAGGTESLTGDLAQGGQLSLTYDPGRLPHCRLNWRGAEVWDIEVGCRFHPGGSVSRQTVLERIRMPSGGMVVGLVPKPVLFDVPLGAERMELWFRNFLPAAAGGRSCEAWDSRFGENYWYDVAPRGPAHPVRYRGGAIPDLGMVNVLAAQLQTKRVPEGGEPLGESSAADVRTLLSLAVWVHNVEYEKNVWVDLHVFGRADELIHSETLPLQYRGPEGGNGDSFAMNWGIFRGTGSGSGTDVWLRPDACKIQYRVYYGVGHRLFSHGILHHAEVPEDAAAQ
ncbi:MAG TPA: DUF6209 family protein [Acidimicrobiales bacterium]|nr:DUF6209 family protein [Acidimicrobiales bacterium]